MGLHVLGAWLCVAHLQNLPVHLLTNGPGDNIRRQLFSIIFPNQGSSQRAPFRLFQKETWQGLPGATWTPSLGLPQCPLCWAHTGAGMGLVTAPEKAQPLVPTPGAPVSPMFSQMFLEGCHRVQDGGPNSQTWLGEHEPPASCCPHVTFTRLWVPTCHPAMASCPLRWEQVADLVQPCHLSSLSYWGHTWDSSQASGARPLGDTAGHITQKRQSGTTMGSWICIFFLKFPHELYSHVK